MTAAATLRVAGDLLNQADKIRDQLPDVAAALESHSAALIETVPCLSVADVADLLGQSRPTIYEWVKAGYLLSEEAGAQSMSISANSLVKLIPILDQWEDDGRPGRPSRLLRQWFADAQELRQRRREFAAKQRAGAIDLKPPRRSTAAPREALPA